MAGRRKKTSSSPTYRVGEKSDVSYVQDARRRIAREGRKRLMVRLVVLAIVVAACVYFGPTVVKIIKGRATQQAAELQEAGDYLKEGRDRRSGVNFDSTE
jgi:hypothetical protein